MRKLGIITAMAISVAGCDGSAPAPVEASPSHPSDSFAGGPFTQREAKAVAPPVTAEGREVEVKNDLFEYKYSYPGAAASIPALKALLDQRLAEGQSKLEASAKQDKAAAGTNDVPYHAYDSGTKWQVVANLPRWLSLSADAYAYTGGAHGMSNFDALLWDREQNVSRAAVDLFTSKAALNAAIVEPFCAALDKQRAKRREAPVNRKSGDEFDKCITPTEHTIILGSSNGRTFDRIGILVEPYAAGPYVEGTYDITVPVTARVLEAVKPQFRGDFSAK